MTINEYYKCKSFCYWFFLSTRDFIYILCKRLTNIKLTMTVHKTHKTVTYLNILTPLKKQYYFEIDIL